jgi:hypothetical protein
LAVAKPGQFDVVSARQPEGDIVTAINRLAGARPGRLLVAVFLAGSALVGPATALGASTDIRAASLTAPKSPLTVLGGSLAPFAVQNTSSLAARRLVVSIVLSKDKRSDRRDPIVGSARLPGLRAGAKRTLRIVLVVPGTVKPGSYWLVACGTAGAQSQSIKANDCVATARKVKVSAATAAVVPKVTAVEPLAVRKVIDGAGGSVTATGPAGGTIVLTVPAKALSIPTAIRIVPATVTPGPRGITPLEAAIVEPEGMLVPGATIEFRAPPGLPAKNLAGFAFGGEDEAMVRAPLIRGKGLSLDASLLGGYGIGLQVPGLRSFETGDQLRLISAAVDPCAAESLRKRADEIMAGVNPGNQDALISATEALVAFEASTVIPAMNAAVNAGATAAELSPIIALALQIERQAALLGVESTVSIIAEVTKALKKAAANEIKKCADRGQGPLKTQTAIYSLARGIELLGGGDVFQELKAKLESDCLSIPYLLTYGMTTDQKFITAQRPPGIISGRAEITDLKVPVPRVGEETTAGSGPMQFVGLTCDAGTTPTFIACAVVNSTATLEAKVIRLEGSTKSEQRCGRTVQVPVYKVVIQLRHPEEQATAQVTVAPPPGSGGSNTTVDLPTPGTFDRALSVGTKDELQQVTLPDDGGNEQLLGNTGDFHGSGISVFATGTAVLKLR